MGTGNRCDPYDNMGNGIMREPLLLSRTISALVVSMAYLYPSKLDKPFQDETRARRASDLPAMASPPLKRIKSGAHRWVIISKLVGGSQHANS